MPILILCICLAVTGLEIWGILSAVRRGGLWWLLYGAEAVALVLCLVLVRFYGALPPSSAFFPGLSYLGEILALYAAAGIQGLTLLATGITHIIEIFK